MSDRIRFSVIGSTIILSEGPEIVGNITVPEPDHEVARVFFRGEKAASAALAEEIAAILNEKFAAPVNTGE